MLVLPWSHVAYGIVVGVIASTCGLVLARHRAPRLLATTAFGVASGTGLWNTMLNVRHAHTIDVDVPFRPFPISWQDVGTGMFCFASVTLLLLATVHREKPGRATLKVALIAAGLALLFDIYIW